MPYGAFVNIEGNIDGLVHISEMAMGRVDSVEDVVQMGQEVQVRISDVNTDNNTVNLSMVPASAYDDRRGGKILSSPFKFPWTEKNKQKRCGFQSAKLNGCVFIVSGPCNGGGRVGCGGRFRSTRRCENRQPMHGGTVMMLCMPITR